MSEKMDRQGVRTPADVERKYNLGQITSAQGSSDKVYTLVQQFQQNMNTRLNELSASLLKEEQEKTIDITENGTTEVVPDEGKVLSKVTVNVDVAGGTEEIENLIDESGVLESAEGSVEDKVEQLIDKAVELDAFMQITIANQLFYGAKSFPTKAVVNLPNTTSMNSAFEAWSSDAMPIVEELTVNAPNVPRLYQAFFGNRRVRKVILNLSDKCQNMTNTFYAASNLIEVVINFPTKNIKEYYGAFRTSSLQKIIGVLDFSSATPTNSNYMFDGCNSLEEVTFAPNTLSLSISLANSSKLTAESVQSIIDGLATVETAQTLTLHKNIVLTDEQKATINAKGWTLAQ